MYHSHLQPNECHRLPLDICSVVVEWAESLCRLHDMVACVNMQSIQQIDVRLAWWQRETRCVPYQLEINLSFKINLNS